MTKDQATYYRRITRRNLVKNVFELLWTDGSKINFQEIRDAATQRMAARQRTGKKKGSRQEGLFKQVVKCLSLLQANPRHPGLKSHEFTSIEHPYRPGEKVWESYVQNRTPGAYRLFWCYGPEKRQITIIAITPHP